MMRRLQIKTDYSVQDISGLRASATDSGNASGKQITNVALK